MILEKEVTVARGGLVARAWDQVKNLLRGRKLHECGRCFGSGIQSVKRLDWDPTSRKYGDPAEALCYLTCCTRCAGAGMTWR